MIIIQDKVDDDHLSESISLNEHKCVFSRECLQLLVLSIKLGAFYWQTNLI